MKLARSYEPNNYEPDIYALWEASGAFKPKGEGEPYSIVMPPPNANGNLHLGHAYITFLQDILIRFYRMQGRDTMYIPGADHAGFETWVVFERELQKQGKSRFDYDREQLYDMVWDFVASKRGPMELQLRALGASADWSKLTFTLDPKVTKTVYDTFQKLWNDGLIYRGERIVNYCTTHQTSFSDIEVEYTNDPGHLWHITYQTEQGTPIIIATTRPETLLGDTAIAVHPDDARYQQLIGTRAILPIVGRTLPIVADDYVDTSFGTGALKVTPAHDPNDFEIAKRHDLPAVSIISADGHLINVPDEFMGLTLEEARTKVVAKLRETGALVKEEPIEHSVGHCYKCKTVIEPMLKEQWFINVQPLAKQAIAAIQRGEISFTPATRAKALVQYLENVHDWNISRQIPWGIPIPAFHKQGDDTDWMFDTRVDQKEIDVNGTTYIREEDTFDTWFSSGQWPFITTDFLDSGDLARFYPLSVMETGADILYQWVGRMIMLGLYRTGQVPFKHVYLNGLINDEHNQKMSKSKGNVINPMDVLTEYGSDALRFGIIVNRSAGQNQAFAKNKVVTGRNFCNKLWNIARFTESKLGNDYEVGPIQPKTPADHWIIRQLNTAAQEIEQHIAHYRFAEAMELVYHTIWDDLADWYIESSKAAPNLPVLSWALSTSLKLAHPFIPFVTETIWQSLDFTTDLLITETWPIANDYDAEQAAAFEQLQHFVREARFMLSELPTSRQYRIVYQDDPLLDANHETLRHLLQVQAVAQVDHPSGLRIASSGRSAWLDVDEDTLYEHKANLQQRLTAAESAIAKLEARLTNPNYVDKAPTHLVAETRQQLLDQEHLAERLKRELEAVS
jgi:valine--tRNA ligase